MRRLVLQQVQVWHVSISNQLSWFSQLMRPDLRGPATITGTVAAACV
jgi:hypothetical protein